MLSKRWAMPRRRNSGRTASVNISASVPTRKGNHESNGLISDQRQDAETAGHGQNLGHRRIVPGTVETAGMQGGRHRQIERPERLQQHIVGGVGQRNSRRRCWSAAAGDDRTSGARKYSGVGGKPVPSATERAASCGHPERHPPGHRPPNSRRRDWRRRDRNGRRRCHRRQEQWNGSQAMQDGIRRQDRRRSDRRTPRGKLLNEDDRHAWSPESTRSLRSARSLSETASALRQRS